MNFLPSVYLSSCSSIRQKELLSPTRVELCLLSVFIHFQGRSVQFVGQSESFSLMSEAHPPRLPFTPFLVWNIRNFGSGIWQKGARRGVRTLAEKPESQGDRKWRDTFKAQKKKCWHQKSSRKTSFFSFSGYFHPAAFPLLFLWSKSGNNTLDCVELNSFIQLCIICHQ